jgi:hypothetical protein
MTPTTLGAAAEGRTSCTSLSAVLHKSANRKRGVCKIGKKTLQRALFSGYSTQGINRQGRLSLAESAVPLASQWAASVAAGSYF